MNIPEDILLNKDVLEQKKPAGIVNGPYGALLLTHYMQPDGSSENGSIIVREQLNHMTEAFNAAPYFSYSIGYGLTGFLWTLQCIGIDSGIQDEIMNRSSLVPLLEAECIRMIQAKNYDLFDGANGLLVYLLSLKKLSANVYNTYTNSLKENLDDTGELILPSSSVYRDNKKLRGINLGIPHGVAGCILMLIRLYEYMPDIKCQKVLDEAVFYFLSKSRKYESGNRYFTYSDHIKSEKPPLAWCYGDLCGGYAITKAGKVLGNTEYADNGIAILDTTLERSDFVIGDLSLCHGAPCIAYLYHKFCVLTGIKRFEERSDFWTTRTKNLLNESHEKYSQKRDHSDFFENSSLIYGYPGLVLTLETMENRLPDNWDNWMLL